VNTAGGGVRKPSFEACMSMGSFSTAKRGGKVRNNNAAKRSFFMIKPVNSIVKQKFI